MNERGALRASLLAALLALTWQAEAGGQVAPSPAATIGNPIADVPLASLNATRERPLFSRGRRPLAAAPVVAPPPRPLEMVVVAGNGDPPPLTLLGTVIGPQDRTAIFMNEGSKAATRLREGERASGWMLVSVGRRSAVLGNDGRIVTLELPNTKAGANALAGGSRSAESIAGDSVADVSVPQRSAGRISAAGKARQVDR
jgi:general secretion pathway protein N